MRVLFKRLDRAVRLLWFLIGAIRIAVLRLVVVRMAHNDCQEFPEL